MSTRELLVRFRRDLGGDYREGRVAFRGCRFFWPDGAPVRTGLSRLCEVGTALLFGRGRPVPEECLLRLCCVTTREDAPTLRPAPHVRARRLFLLREGSRGVLHFRNGARTEVAFEDGVDEPAVLCWLGLDTLPAGTRLWLDFFALPAEAVAASAGGSRPAW
jgi:hypothetical protein